MLRGTAITQRSGARFTTGIGNEKLDLPHTFLLSLLETQSWRRGNHLMKVAVEIGIFDLSQLFDLIFLHEAKSLQLVKI